ncbi:hypothetical protein V5O48_018758, partial [Marasmius crinis-equi]
MTPTTEVSSVVRPFVQHVLSTPGLLLDAEKISGADIAQHLSSLDRMLRKWLKEYRKDVDVLITDAFMDALKHIKRELATVADGDVGKIPRPDGFAIFLDPEYSDSNGDCSYDDWAVGSSILKVQDDHNISSGSESEDESSTRDINDGPTTHHEWFWFHKWMTPTDTTIKDYVKEQVVKRLNCAIAYKDQRPQQLKRINLA